MSIAKPTLDKAAAALAFAESKPEQAAPVAPAEKKGFYAPEGHRRLTINLPEDLHKQLRQMALDQDCTVTDIIVSMARKEIDK